MNGPQDMGGTAGFGPINPEAGEPVFHAEWERRAFALTLAMGMTGSWNIDISRHARERMPALEYWRSSYYEIWLTGIERMMRERGLVTDDEMKAGHAEGTPMPVKRVAQAAAIAGLLKAGGPVDRPAAGRHPLFAPGDKVRARNINPEGHTRLPRYVRGREGEICRVHGCHVFPDSSAHGGGDDPQWLYNVRFASRALWGAGHEGFVHIDLWEPYLEAL